MDLQEELAALAARAFTNDLMRKLISEMHARSVARGGGRGEADDQAAKEALAGALSEAQTEDLRLLETLYAENARFAMGFAFTRGLYAGFQQYFVHDSTEKPFGTLVMDPLIGLETPGPRVYTA